MELNKNYGHIDKDGIAIYVNGQETERWTVEQIEKNCMVAITAANALKSFYEKEQGITKKIKIDEDGIYIYDDKDTEIVMWSIDEIEEDAYVALIASNAIKIFYEEGQDELKCILKDDKLRDIKPFWYDGYKFADTFWTPYDDYKDKIGLKFEVVRRCTTEDVDAECLPVWLIKFEDGEEINAYPEEIIEEEINTQKLKFPFLENRTDEVIYNKETAKNCEKYKDCNIYGCMFSPTFEQFAKESKAGIWCMKCHSFNNKIE